MRKENCRHSTMAQTDPQELAGNFIHPEARRGRGARTNDSGRYETARRTAFDDGWGHIDDEPPPLRTTLIRDTSRTIIATNTSPDIPFSQSINPYRGCEHGCIYCFARPTHAYLGFSPGLDFESKLLTKPDAARLLEDALRHPRYRPQVIAMGTNTDIYQPADRTLGISRQILDVLRQFRHPVSIVTKSALILRDIDLLSEMAAHNLVHVSISVTSLERQLSRRMEPRAATPARRIETLHRLSEAGIPTSVMVAPVIPAINDSEIEAILTAARDAGAQMAAYILLRLPLEIKTLFREWLEDEFPDKASHCLGLLREMRGGRDNDPQFHRRMRGTGPYADLIARRFAVAARKRGLKTGEGAVDLDLSQFRVPPRSGDQLDLFSA